MSYTPTAPASPSLPLRRSSDERSPLLVRGALARRRASPQATRPDLPAGRDPRSGQRGLPPLRGVHEEGGDRERGEGREAETRLRGDVHTAGGPRGVQKELTADALRLGGQAGAPPDHRQASRTKRPAGGAAAALTALFAGPSAS